VAILIALGGTGQEVAHFYLEATILGLANTAQRVASVVIIDQDTFAPSLRALADLCNAITSVGAPRVPTVRLVTPFLFENNDASVAEVLTGSKTAQLARNAPIRAFYATQRTGAAILDQPLKEGFYYKPSMAVVLDSYHRARIDQYLHFTDDRAVVVGSLLGGTGAGLLVPVLDRLDAEHKTAVGILFDRWFPMDSITEAEKRTKQAALYDSNRAGVLSMLAARQNNIVRWVLLGGDVPRRRTGFGDAAEDFHGVNDPRFEACLLIDELLPGDFEGQQLTFDGARRTAAPALVQERFNQWHGAVSDAKGILASIQRDEWITALPKDPLAAYAWGTKLSTYVSNTWRVVHERSVRTGAIHDAAQYSRDLTTGVQNAARTLYRFLPGLSPTTGIDRLTIKQRGTRLPDRYTLAQQAPNDYESLCAGFAGRLTCTLVEIGR
jgi:hypothetical protein